jgi:hypothetical protein
MKDSTLTQAKKRWALMTRYLERPSSINDKFLTACASQPALAAFSSDDLGLRPISLNSLKAAVEIVVENGGWDAFDGRRRDIRRLCTLSKKNSQPAPESEYKTNARSLDNADRARLLLGRAYNDLLILARTFAKKDDELAERLKRHETLWRDQLTLPLKKP